MDEFTEMNKIILFKLIDRNDIMLNDLTKYLDCMRKTGR